MSDRRRSSDGDADYHAMQAPDQPTRPKWGFHFLRLMGICILTFAITIFLLIYDNLSISKKKITDDLSTDGATCKVVGYCGWRTAEYTYTMTGTYTGCDTGTFNINYATYCNKNYNQDCKAMDAGNVYLAFSIISLITLLLLLLIFIPAWIKKPIVGEKVQKSMRIILIILFTITWLSEFLAAFVWLFMSKCDDADPQDAEIFSYDTANSFGVSTGLLLLCFVANLIGFGAVACCWTDFSLPDKNPPAEQDL